MKEDPDIILLNSTCQTDQNRIKIFGLNVHQRNKWNENHAGVAIAIKRNISYKLLDDFQDDILSIQLETSRGSVIISTCYLPPRRQAFPLQDVTSLFRKNIPVYMAADLNARHRFVEHSDNNQTGNVLNSMIQRELVTYLGPDFNM